MAALAKDPAHRWQSADDFAAGLAAAGEQIAAGPVVGQDTAAFAPIPMPVPAPARGAPPAAGGEPRPEEQRRRRWPLFTIGLLTLALAAFLIFLAVTGLTATETREVPRVTGTQLIEAREILERAGFEVEETRVQSEAPLDRVLDQDPDPAEEAEEGSTVVLEVSGGPGTVRVPSLAGLRPKQVVAPAREPRPHGGARRSGPRRPSKRAWPSARCPGPARWWSAASRSRCSSPRVPSWWRCPT